jgi:hypothetical protein
MIKNMIFKVMRKYFVIYAIIYNNINENFQLLVDIL